VRENYFALARTHTSACRLAGRVLSLVETAPVFDGVALVCAMFSSASVMILMLIRIVNKKQR